MDSTHRITFSHTTVSEAAIENAVATLRSGFLSEGKQVKRFEEEGDALYHQAVGELFKGDPYPIDVIKWKELYDTLERALDRCQTAAIVLESISLKNS